MWGSLEQEAFEFMSNRTRDLEVYNKSEVYLKADKEREEALNELAKYDQEVFKKFDNADGERDGAVEILCYKQGFSDVLKFLKYLESGMIHNTEEVEV